MTLDSENSTRQGSYGSSQTPGLGCRHALRANKITRALQREGRFLPKARCNADLYTSFQDVENTVGRITLSENDLSLRYIQERLARAGCCQVLVQRLRQGTVCRCHSSCGYHVRPFRYAEQAIAFAGCIMCSAVPGEHSNNSSNMKSFFCLPRRRFRN